MKFILTPEIEAELRALRTSTSLPRLAAHFGTTRNVIWYCLKKMGLRLTKEERIALSQKYRVPKKRTSPRCDAFPVGQITQVSNGKAQVFKIKTAEGWVPYNRFLWLQAGNDIPKGFVVGFKDLNPTNCVLDNLYLVIRGNWQKRKATGRNPRKPNPDKNKKRDEAAKQRRLIKSLNQEEREKASIERRKFKCRERYAAKTAEARMIREQKKKEQEATDIQKKRTAEVSREWSRQAKRTKAKEKRMTTKTVDLSQKIAIRLDSRTLIFINPGQDIEEVKARYKKAS